MKNLFLKFKISNSLNRGGPLSGFWMRRVAASADLEQFKGAARELDRLLKEPADRETGEVPAGLHASIMKAVREERAAAKPARDRGISWMTAPALRWAAAAALLLLLGTASWMVLHHHDQAGPGKESVPQMAHGDGPSALPPVGAVVEGLASNSVAILSAPVNRQIEDLSRDLRETAQFLLASLP